MERFNTFVSNIYQIYRSIQKIKNFEMAEFGLKGMHVLCLFHLNHSKEVGEITAAKLCKLCAEDKAAISRVIADLEAKKLIALNKSDNKRSYRSEITLSTQGKVLADKMDHLIEFAVETGGEGLRDDDRKVFYKSLELISNNLQKYSEEKK